MLATRCPACTTAFKIVPDQLKLSQGWVRCGKCGEVFNATQHFVQVPPAVAAATTAATSAAAASSPVAAPPPDSRLLVPPAVQPTVPSLAAPAVRPTVQPSSTPSAAPFIAPEAALALAAAAKQAPVWQRIVAGPADAAMRPSTITNKATNALETEVAQLLANVGKNDAPSPPLNKAAKLAAEPSAKSPPANPEFANTASPAVAGRADASIDLDVDDNDQSPQTLLPALEIDLPLDNPPPSDLRNLGRRAGDPRAGDSRPGDSRLGESRLGDSRFSGMPSRTADSAVRLGTGTRPQRRRRDDRDRGDSDSDSDSVPLERDLRGSEPAFLKQARRRERWQSWPVRVLLLLLVLAGLGGLAAQTAYWLRDDIATHYPAARPLLAAACAEFSQLQCSLEAVERLQDIVIESSALNPGSKDAGAASNLELTAVLKNRLRSANRWPALEVTLTDARDVVVVRKVLTAQEYLYVKPNDKPSDKPGAAPPIDPAMRGFGEYNARLVIDTQNLDVVGYRLAIFYP